MLTAKVIHKNYTEEVFQINSSEFNPNGGVSFDRAGPGLQSVSAGQVYIMNEAGKTVASYDLRTALPVPGDLNIGTGSAGQI